ncbi:unnamed protein product [Sympodiomycopsis kandeliae]
MHHSKDHVGSDSVRSDWTVLEADRFKEPVDVLETSLLSLPPSPCRTSVTSQTFTVHTMDRPRRQVRPPTRYNDAVQSSDTDGLLDDNEVDASPDATDRSATQASVSNPWKNFNPFTIATSDLFSLRSAETRSVSNSTCLYNAWPHLADPQRHGVCLLTNTSFATAGDVNLLDRCHHIPKSPLAFDANAGRMQLTIFLSGLHRIVGSLRQQGLIVNNIEPDQYPPLTQDEPEDMRRSFMRGLTDPEEAREICEDLARHVLRYPPNMTLLRNDCARVYDHRAVVFIPLVESLCLWIENIVQGIKDHRNEHGDDDLTSWRPPYKTLLRDGNYIHPIPSTGNLITPDPEVGTTPRENWDQHTYHTFTISPIGPLSAGRTYMVDGQGNSKDLPIGACYAGTRHSNASFHPFFLVIRTAFLGLSEEHPHLQPGSLEWIWWRDSIAGCKLLTKLCLAFLLAKEECEELFTQAENFLSSQGVGTGNAIPTAESDPAETAAPEAGPGRSATKRKTSPSAASSQSSSTPTDNTQPLQNFDEDRVECFRSWLRECESSREVSLSSKKQNRKVTTPTTHVTSIAQKARTYLEQAGCVSSFGINLRPDKLPSDFFRAMHNPQLRGSIWCVENDNDEEDDDWLDM